MHVLSSGRKQRMHMVLLKENICWVLSKMAEDGNLGENNC